MRKTISIIDLINEVNKRNAESTCAAGIRMGWNAMLEHYLHENNCYKGYNNLTREQVPLGHKPGILWDTVDGHWSQGAATIHDPAITDDSRRFYYTHKRLEK